LLHKQFRQKQLPVLYETFSLQQISQRYG